MKRTQLVCGLGLVLSALAACGDSGTTATGAGGSGGSGGDVAGGGGAQQQGGGGNGGTPQGGNGGTAQGGGGEAGGVANGGAGGDGGAGGAGGGNGGAGGAGGAGGGVADGSDGSLCETDMDCNGGLCLSELDTGLPGGMCSEDCTQSGMCTDPASACLGVGDGGLCFRLCDSAVMGSCGAPATLECLNLDDPTPDACVAGCTADTDCTVAGNVCQADGICAPPEVCDNMTDDDLDGDADCADADCAMAMVCTAACNMAPAAMAMNSGNTTNGTNVLGSGCTSEPAGGEVVYTYTAAGPGTLALTLVSASDQGLHVRTGCASGELACSDQFVGGTNETLSVPLSPANLSVFIVVDAYAAGDEGPFTLSLTFTPAPPENCINFADDDLDERPDCSDSVCTGTAPCLPGATALNGTCTANTNCASVAGGDPVCLTPAAGVNVNMCSEWCNLAANDCPMGAECFDVGYPAVGLCLSTCTVAGDCPMAFDCVQGNCLPSVPAAWTCDDAYFFDGPCDCGCGVQDPDCENNLVASCDYCDDMGSCSATACPGTINPTNNAVCTN